MPCARSAARSAWRMRPSASANRASSCSRRRAPSAARAASAWRRAPRRASPPCRRRRAAASASGSGRSSVTSLDQVGVALARGVERLGVVGLPRRRRRAARRRRPGRAGRRCGAPAGTGSCPRPGCSCGRPRSARAPGSRAPSSRPPSGRRRTARRSRTRVSSLEALADHQLVALLEDVQRHELVRAAARGRGGTAGSARSVSRHRSQASLVRPR